jgi:dihydroorotate dehydrogenase
VLYEALARPVVFRVGGGDPEAAHDRTVQLLSRLSRRPKVLAAARRLFGTASGARTVFGVRFPGAVGLAAGMDKDGLAVPAWGALGFGFVEVGTVTARAQPGNPRPRLFRVRGSEALVNRMGFNNSGAQALAGRLAAYGPLPLPVGVSLGKSADAPLEEAVEDYVTSLRLVLPYADYVAVNVSSPNTAGLRSLQDRDQLSLLLYALRAQATKPLLVKIAPDLSERAICEVLEVCTEHRVDGLIATNTTVSRAGVAAADAALAAEAGGLSGRPLGARAREVVRFVARETAGRLPVIGVGGIVSPEDALRMFDAGASLVQLYTGLVYHGPGLVRRINRMLAAGDR